MGLIVTRAFARLRLRRLPFCGVPRAVLDSRARAGFGPGRTGGHHDDDMLRGLYAFQVQVRVDDAHD